MSVLIEVTSLVGEVLQIPERVPELSADSELLGAIPEFDSMAVVSMLTAIEEHFDIIVEDDEVSGETFATIGSLARYVEDKLAAP